MDFGLSAEQEAFQAEVRELFDSPAMADELARLAARPVAAEPDPRPAYRLLGRHRMLAPGWPVEWGGRGLSPFETALVVEEMVRRGVPETLHTLSVQIVGQFLLWAASPAQQEALLPRLGAGDAFATVLYSEEEAGSDLAALTTEARAAGDGFTLHGRKVYSVKSQLADQGLCAARTGSGASRYQGITLFLVPLDAPGVRVEPMPSLADERFCEVLLEGVRVGSEAVVGRVGEAWPLITRALALERTAVDHYAKAERWLRLGIEQAAARGELEDPGLVESVGRLGARADASRFLSWRVLTQMAEGQVDEVTAAMAKWYGSETARRAAWWAAEVAGMEACLARTGGASPVAGELDSIYREAPGLTISAGTSEMMLQVVASSGFAGEG